SCRVPGGATDKNNGAAKALSQRRPAAVGPGPGRNVGPDSWFHTGGSRYNRTRVTAGAGSWLTPRRVTPFTPPGLGTGACAFKSGVRRSAPPPRERAGRPGGVARRHWLSRVVFWNVSGNLERSDWAWGLLVCVPRSQRPPRGPRSSVPGSSTFYYQAGPGSGAGTGPPRLPVGALKPRLRQKTMAEFSQKRGKRRDDEVLGSAVDFLLANARLVLGVGGAAVLGIATLAVKRLMDRATSPRDEDEAKGDTTCLEDSWKELSLLKATPCLQPRPPPAALSQPLSPLPPSPSAPDQLQIGFQLSSEVRLGHLITHGVITCREKSSV
uniref:Mitochondrial elongation factor 2 n=1 Tax=Equus caballus TaxID=9796 RepID=A0A9L0TPX2_HORSE